MSAVLSFLVGFLFLGTVFTWLERRFPGCTPAPLLRRVRLVDLGHWAFGQTAGKWIAEGVTFVAILALALVFRIPLRHFDTWMAERSIFGRLPWFFQVPIALLFLDFLGYWHHRLMHATRLFRLHAIHHSSRSLDWLSAARNHPLAEAFGRVVVAVPILFLGIDPRVLVPLVPFLGVWGLFAHANVSFRLHALRYLVVTPHFHRWHHSCELDARGKNFAGIFPLWDLMFGTFYFPDRKPIFFGVLPGAPEDVVPETFFGQMLHPLRGIRKKRRRPSEAS